MKQELNYEARLFYWDKPDTDDFDFHGDSKELAKDHIAHVARATKNCEVIHYRKKGNVKWEIVYNGKQPDQPTTPNRESEQEQRAKQFKIIANTEDHAGYKGELVTIAKELPDNYFIVKNAAGKEWQVGEEEIEEQGSSTEQLPEELFIKGDWIIDSSHLNPDLDGVTVWANNVPGHNNSLIICHVISDQHMQHKANALLICEAKNMFQLLKEIEQDMYVRMSATQRQKAKAILSRITGNQ